MKADTLTKGCNQQMAQVRTIGLGCTTGNECLQRGLRGSGDSGVGSSKTDQQMEEVKVRLDCLLRSMSQGTLDGFVSHDGIGQRCNLELRGLLIELDDDIVHEVEDDLCWSRVLDVGRRCKSGEGQGNICSNFSPVSVGDRQWEPVFEWTTLGGATDEMSVEAFFRQEVEFRLQRSGSRVNMDSNSKLDCQVLFLETEALQLPSADYIERLHYTRNSGPCLCQYHEVLRIQLVADCKYNLVRKSHVDDISQLCRLLNLEEATLVIAHPV